MKHRMHLLTSQASRAQILKQATDYIQYMSKKNNIIQHDIDDVKKQNQVLEQQGGVTWCGRPSSNDAFSVSIGVNITTFECRPGFLLLS